MPSPVTFGRMKRADLQIDKPLRINKGVFFSIEQPDVFVPRKIVDIKQDGPFEIIQTMGDFYTLSGELEEGNKPVHIQFINGKQASIFDDIDAMDASWQPTGAVRRKPGSILQEDLKIGAPIRIKSGSSFGDEVPRIFIPDSITDNGRTETSTGFMAFGKVYDLEGNLKQSNQPLALTFDRSGRSTRYFGQCEPVDPAWQPKPVGRTQAILQQIKHSLFLS